MVQQYPSPASKNPLESGRLSGGLLATLFGGGLLAVFIVQNTEEVTLKFLFWSFTWPVWLLTVVAAVLGSILWVGLGVLRRHRRRVARRNSRDD